MRKAKEQWNYEKTERTGSQIFWNFYAVYADLHNRIPRHLRLADAKSVSWNDKGQCFKTQN
ncbi:MAG: hypothetical protein K2P22_07145 [Lachnospiraceae bacterium]|nr:hypothetical protein [Lachnospiraceae bacterium]